MLSLVIDIIGGLFLSAASGATLYAVDQSRYVTDEPYDSISAQSFYHGRYVRPVQPFEFQANFGISSPFGADGINSPVGSINFGVEARYNLPRNPFSVGAMLDFYGALYKDEEEELYGMPGKDYGGLLAGPMFECDFRRGKLINPYVYSAAGLGFSYYNDDNLRPFVRLGGGLELFHWIRIGASTTLMPGNGSGFSMTISSVFGGWPKKPKNVQPRIVPSF